MGEVEEAEEVEEVQEVKEVKEVEEVEEVEVGEAEQASSPPQRVSTVFDQSLERGLEWALWGGVCRGHPIVLDNRLPL